MGLVPSIWKEQRLIESFDVDTLGRLRPQTLFAYLLNSARKHPKGTNSGQDELFARNLMWALIPEYMFHMEPNHGGCNNCARLSYCWASVALRSASQVFN